ncbi:hypothetical protein ACSFCW_09380 [Yokenella regensburgei]|uniref:hypothetical protein n=1 Tax=Yokenella regensburgei TaxID=158877 RepID=UPI003EDB2B10
MKKLNVTITHLEQYIDGVICGAKVTYKVLQGGEVLVEDSVSGKASHPFTKTYDVNANGDSVYVTHDRPDLSWLTITAEIVE